MRTSKRLLFVAVTMLVLLGAGAIAFAAVTFTDIDGHWAKDAIMRLADRGIIQGHADGTFGPDEFVTRAQVATFMDRLDTEDGDCAACHNETTLITGKEAQYGLSVHGAGLKGEEVTVGDVTFATPGESAFELALAEGTNPSCTGCHSGNGFSARIAAGQDPPEVTAGQTDPTRVDCRACHQTHETFTGADWALETEAPVAFYALPGVTFDGGAGNLCANCHQPRVAFPAAVDGMVTIASTRFGPHHGPQAATLVGAGGATRGDPSPHMGVPDTCITCHMGPDNNHLFEASVERCQGCHAGAESLDINGVQTYVQMLIDQLKPLLVDAGMLNGTTEAAIAGTYPEAKAAALWNWRDIRIEDKSKGVHNPDYVIGLLTAGIEAFGETPVARP